MPRDSHQLRLQKANTARRPSLWQRRGTHTWTRRGLPNLSALSRFFLKASSRKLVRVIFRSLYSFMMNSVACPEGSMISGYLGMGRGWADARGARGRDRQSLAGRGEVSQAQMWGPSLQKKPCDPRLGAKILVLRTSCEGQ